MSTNNSTGTSGEGTRPTTSGGIDNIGGADAFIPGKKKPPGVSTKQPAEKMSLKRQASGSDEAADPSRGNSGN